MPEQSNSKPAEFGISILIPVYNEGEGLESFTQNLKTVIDSIEIPFEIIYVDDGSEDSTSSILAAQPYTMIRHEFNRGYGASIKTGLEHSHYDSIVIIDADGTYSPGEILSMVEHLHSYDMVVGTRTGPDSHIPLTRRPAKWLIRVFAAWMVRQTIPDLNSGLRAIKRKEIMAIKRLLPDGFSLTTTVTIAFLSMGKRIYYHPIRYNKRVGKSKFHPITDTWNMILLILRTVVLLRPLNVFLPLCFLFAFFAFGVLILSKPITGQFMDATFIVLMMASVQMFVLGLIADLIVRINLWTH